MSCSPEGTLLARHRAEELAQSFCELGGALEVRLDQAREKLAGQQADVFREKAEEQAHEEVGGSLRGTPRERRLSASLENCAAASFGDLLSGLPGLQPSGIGEHGAQDFSGGNLQVSVGGS